MRDITLNETFRHHFTTRQFSDGVPTVLAGSPVISVHEEANDTFITAGITLDVSIGSSPVIGLNEVAIIATTGNGYEAGKSYCIFISTGTVGGVSVVGEVVGHFTVALSAAAVDLANGTDGLTELRTLLLDIPTVSEFDARTQPTADYFDPAVDDVDVRSLQGGVVTAASIASNAITALKLSSGCLTSTKFAADSLSASALAAATVQKIVDGILDEASASHVTAGSVGLTIDNLPNDGALSDISDETEKISAADAGVGIVGSLINEIENRVTPAQMNLRTILAADYFDPAADTVVNVTNVATLTGHTNQTGDSFVRLGAPIGASISADLQDVPTVAEFNLRTILSGAYFDPAVDDVDVRSLQANVITTASIAANAINAGKLATGTIIAATIASGAIDDTKFSVGAITAVILATDAIDKIRDGILPTQNVAFTFNFLFVDNTDHVTPVTGATGTGVTRSIDGAAFGAGGGTLTEIANGMYEYAANTGDMNGAAITFRFTASGGTPNAPDDAFVTIFTGGAV